MRTTDRTKREAMQELKRAYPHWRHYRCADGPEAGETFLGAPGIVLLVVQPEPTDPAIEFLVHEPDGIPDSFDPAGVPMAIGRYDLQAAPGFYPTWCWTAFPGWTPAWRRWYAERTRTARGLSETRATIARAIDHLNGIYTQEDAR